jgi:hypothetical protein
MNSPRTSNRTSNFQTSQLNRVGSLAIGVCALSAALTLAGCGTAPGSSSEAVAVPAAIQINGMVHGGQQPVSGATIQLYTVGTSGLKSASTAMISSSVTSGTTGAFSITGTYNCTTLPATQVYITATGGNPGAGTNSALTMMAALGPCTGLSSSTFINIDEVTTVAAAYALAPFAADILHIGASGTNPIGLVNAFTNASVLANTSTGTAGGASLGTGVTVPMAEINTLADIIAACVNTSGATSSSCSTLFSATGASETFGAALGIAKNPGSAAITALYTMAVPASPFQPTLGTAPNDFTVAVTSTGNGTLATPYGIAIDATGNAWVTNEGGSTITELNVNGNSAGTQTATGLFGAEGIAIDRSGNVWVANTAGNSVVKFAVTAGSVTGSSSFNVGGLSAPAAIAMDSASTAWVANLNGNSVTAIASGGTAVSGSPFTGSGNNITVPTAIAVSPTGTIYVTSGKGSVVNLNNAGAFVATLSDGTLQGPDGVAVDTTGRILAAGFTTGSATGGALSQFTSAGAAVSSSPYTSGITAPAGVASDGTSIWVANNAVSGSLAQFSYTSSAPLSPTAGFGSLTSPVGVAIDSSGSIWTTNSGSNTVSKFIGLATPVTTPIAATAGP